MYNKEEFKEFLDKEKQNFTEVVKMFLTGAMHNYLLARDRELGEASVLKYKVGKIPKDDEPVADGYVIAQLATKAVKTAVQDLSKVNIEELLEDYETWQKEQE